MLASVDLPGRGVAEIASMPRRLAGGLLDLLVLAIACGVLLALALPALSPGPSIDAATGAVQPGGWNAVLVTVVVTGAVQALYHVLGIGWWGRTVGGYVLGIRADRAGRRPGLLRGLLRWIPVGGIWLVGSLAGLAVPWAASAGTLVALLVVLSPLTDRRGLRRGLQDRLAGVLVVRG